VDWTALYLNWTSLDCNSYYYGWLVPLSLELVTTLQFKIQNDRLLARLARSIFNLLFNFKGMRDAAIGEEIMNKRPSLAFVDTSCSNG
jgi:hypothetical protein